MHAYNGVLTILALAWFFCILYFVFCVSVKVKLTVSLLCVCVHSTWKGRPRNDLCCVGWHVKPYSLTHSITAVIGKLAIDPWLLKIQIDPQQQTFRATSAGVYAHQRSDCPHTAKGICDRKSEMSGSQNFEFVSVHRFFPRVYVHNSREILDLLSVRVRTE